MTPLERVHVGIIGCGRISTLQALGYLDHSRAEVTAVCDRDEDLTRQRQEEWGAKKRYTDYQPLPSSLFEALRALENDHEFLLQGEVFDEGQIMEWIKVKMDEYYGVRNRPHPIEIAMYFDA